MHTSQRNITELPLQELWDDRGMVAARRLRDLAAADVRELLRSGPVRFVVAGLGAKPKWVPESDCFAFWKSEVQARVAVPGNRIVLEDFPSGYCYVAAAWEAEGRPIVVLQICH
jgi:hypothetical protein